VNKVFVVVVVVVGNTDADTQCKVSHFTFEDVQYCAKVMQTIIDEYRALFSRFLADISTKHRTDRQMLK